MNIKVLKICKFPSRSFFRLFNSLTLFILFLSSQGLRAEDQSFVLSDNRGLLKAASNLTDWKYHKDMLGLPHVYLKSSSNNKKHSSLSITFTGEQLLMDGKALAKKIKEYQDGRKSWAKSRDIKIAKFYPFETFETKNKLSVKIVGFDYSSKFLKNMTEKSIYINCPDKSLIHMKAILLSEHKKELKKILEFIKSITECKKLEI